jgi:hypothetical protein
MLGKPQTTVNFSRQSLHTVLNNNMSKKINDLIPGRRNKAAADAAVFLWNYLPLI